MRQVYVAKDPIDAHLALSLLMARGIRAEVRNEHLWSARGELPLGPCTSPTVWVEGEDLVHAEVALKGLKGGLKNRLGGLPARPCPSCGEELEAHFFTCWSCGTDTTAA